MKQVIKSMIEAEMQEIAKRYHEEHGVDIVIGTHIMDGGQGKEGCYTMGMACSDSASFIMNASFLSSAIIDMLCDLGVPKEAVDMCLDKFAARGEGRYTPPAQKMNA